MAKNFAELYAALSPESRQWVEEHLKVEEEKVALPDLPKAEHLSQPVLPPNMGIKQPALTDMEERPEM